MCRQHTGKPPHTFSNVMLTSFFKVRLCYYDSICKYVNMIYINVCCVKYYTCGFLLSLGIPLPWIQEITPEWPDHYKTATFKSDGFLHIWNNRRLEQQSLQRSEDAYDVILMKQPIMLCNYVSLVGRVISGFVILQCKASSDLSRGRLTIQARILERNGKLTW